MKKYALPPKNFTFSGIFLALFCFFGFSPVFGQHERGDRERMVQEQLPNEDPSQLMEGSVAPSAIDDQAIRQQQNRPQNRPTASDAFRNRSQQPAGREEQQFKNGGERDRGREGVSTLSFNLFLYVIDKFKED